MVQIYKVISQNSFAKHNGFYDERILFKSVVNFFDLAGSDVNISDESSEGAEYDSTAVCDDRGYGLQITGLKIFKLEESLDGLFNFNHPMYGAT